MNDLDSSNEFSDTEVSFLNNLFQRGEARSKGDEGVHSEEKPEEPNQNETKEEVFDYKAELSIPHQTEENQVEYHQDWLSALDLRIWLDEELFPLEPSCSPDEGENYDTPKLSWNPLIEPNILDEFYKQSRKKRVRLHVSKSFLAVFKDHWKESHERTQVGQKLVEPLGEKTSWRSADLKFFESDEIIWENRAAIVDLPNNEEGGKSTERKSTVIELGDLTLPAATKPSIISTKSPEKLDENQEEEVEEDSLRKNLAPTPINDLISIPEGLDSWIEGIAKTLKVTPKSDPEVNLLRNKQRKRKCSSSFLCPQRNKAKRLDVRFNPTSWAHSTIGLAIQQLAPPKPMQEACPSLPVVWGQIKGDQPTEEEKLRKRRKKRFFGQRMRDAMSKVSFFEESLAEPYITYKNPEVEKLKWFDLVQYEQFLPRSKIKKLTALEWHPESVKKEKDDDSKNDRFKVLDLSRPDALNLGNDQRYRHRRAKKGNTLSFHSGFVNKLIPSVFPTSWASGKWKQWHRPVVMVHEHLVPVLQYIPADTEKERKRQIKRSQQGYIPRTRIDVSARENRVILCEYLEQYPLFLYSTGMASKIVHYYLQKNEDDEYIGPEPDDGVVREVLKMSSVLPAGNINSGDVLTMFSNELYTSPVAKHALDPCMFLLTKVSKVDKKNVGRESSGSKEEEDGESWTYFIRPLDGAYAVGQLQPLKRLLTPNTREWKNYMRNRVKFDLYTKLRSSQSKNLLCRVTVKQVTDHFRSFPKSEIKKALRMVFQKEVLGSQFSKWKPRKDAFCPSVAELHHMLGPTMVCRYESMEAGVANLENKGVPRRLTVSCWKIISKNLHISPRLKELIDKIPKDSGRRKIATFIYGQLVNSPWFLTESFARAQRGDGELRIDGSANPFKEGMGFDYHREYSDRYAEDIKKAVAVVKGGGPKSDLRVLNVEKMKHILKETYGYKEVDLIHKDRWSLCSLVQREATKEVEKGITSSVALRYSREAKGTVNHRRKIHQKQLASVFQAHLKMIRSKELKSQVNEDELADWENDFDVEEVLEESQSGPPLSSTLRRGISSPSSIITFSSASPSLCTPKQKILKYTYEWTDETGLRRRETRVIKNPQIITDYLQDKKDGKNRIAKYGISRLQKWEEKKAQLEKEAEKTRKRKRIERQLQLLDRSDEQKRKMLAMSKKNISCSACGQPGHMRTNSACPMFRASHKNAYDLGVLKDTSPTGTNITINVKKILDVQKQQNAEDRRVMKIAREEMEREMFSKRRTTGRSTRGHPRIHLATILSGILKTVTSQHDAAVFLDDPSRIPFYSHKIRCPMWFYRIRDIIKRTEASTQRMGAEMDMKIYSSHREFLDDVHLIVTNSETFNGAESEYTIAARKLEELAIEGCEKKKDSLKEFEEHILRNQRLENLNPLLTRIVEFMEMQQNAVYFLKPVDKQVVPGYYDKIKRPMDLLTISKHIQYGHYLDFKSFCDDISLMYKNTYTFNGYKHAVTQACKDLLLRTENFIEKLMIQIKAVDGSFSQNGEEGSVLFGKS